MKKCYSLLALLIYMISACNPKNVPSPAATRVVQSISTQSPASLALPSEASTKLPVGVQTPRATNQCIGPLATSWFQFGDAVPPADSNLAVLPADWSALSTIPESLASKDALVFLVLVRPRQSHDELWAYNYSSRTFLVYRTDIEEWRQASVSPPGPSIFLDTNGNIWASVHSPDEHKPIFYRANETRKTFEPIMDDANQLNNGQIVDLRIGSNGLFWFIFEVNDTHERSLYSFDPRTLEAKHYLSGKSYQGLEIGKNGDLYIMQSPDTLIKYMPAINSISSVNIPSDFEPYGGGTSLYLDHKDRLWVSDRVWFDLSYGDLNRWYILIRSPIFIDYLKGIGRYAWTRPEIQLESKDGILWYSSTRGDAWFSPETGEWCLFTTYSGKIVEDSQHSLWILIDNVLYKSN